MTKYTLNSYQVLNPSAIQLLIQNVLHLSNEEVVWYLENGGIEENAADKLFGRKRRKIREEVRESNLLNAEKLKEKYNKNKRMNTEEFNVGDRVAVKIPKEDRSGVDVKRIPCVITHKTVSPHSFYTLLCEHGELVNKYLAGSLMPFSGIVHIGKPGLKIALQMEHSLFFVSAEKAAKQTHANVSNLKCYVQHAVIKARTNVSI